MVDLIELAVKARLSMIDETELVQIATDLALQGHEGAAIEILALSDPCPEDLIALAEMLCIEFGAVLPTYDDAITALLRQYILKK